MASGDVCSQQSCDRQASEEAVEEIHRNICQGLHGKSFTVTLVGPAGVGKSTLVNTIVMRPECPVSRGAAPVTSTVSKHTIVVPLHGAGEATVNVYDSPGFTGDDKEDERTTEALRNVGLPDILLICFAMDSDGGRYTAMKHGFILSQIKNVWGEEKMAERAIIVLTKCNLVCDYYEREQRRATGQGRNPATFTSEVDTWKRTFTRSQGNGSMADIPICIAGRVEFGTNAKPASVTKIAGGTRWLQELWNTVACYSDSGLAPLLYVSADTVHQDPAIPTEVKANLPKPGEPLLSKVLIFAAGFAAASVACAALATMGPAGTPMAVSTARLIATGAQVAVAGYAAGNSQQAFGGIEQIVQGLGLHWGWLKG